MEANEIQIGGDHYGGKKLQHWDFAVRVLGNRYLEGALTKYVMRHRKKGVGEQDLRKAAHFLTKLVEEHEAGRIAPLMRPQDGKFDIHAMTVEHGLNVDEALIVEAVAYWTTGNDLQRIHAALARLLRDETERQRRAQAVKAGAEPIGDNLNGD